MVLIASICPVCGIRIDRHTYSTNPYKTCDGGAYKFQASIAALTLRSVADAGQLRPHDVARDFPQHARGEHVGWRGEQHANVPHGGRTVFVLYDAVRRWMRVFDMFFFSP